MFLLGSVFLFLPFFVTLFSNVSWIQLSGSLWWREEKGCLGRWVRVQDVLSGRLQFRVHSLSVVLRLLKCWNEMALCQVTNDNDCCSSFLGNRLHCLYKSPLRSLVGWSVLVWSVVEHPVAGSSWHQRSRVGMEDDRFIQRSSLFFHLLFTPVTLLSSQPQWGAGTEVGPPSSVRPSKHILG